MDCRFLGAVLPVSLRLQCLLVIAVCGLVAHSGKALATDLTPIEQLGQQLFFDKNLSSPPGQACASCHSPETGFTGPDSAVNASSGVYPGATSGRFGNRKPQAVAYSSFSPKRHYDAKDETYVGGQFWDGRADDLVEQAKGSFLNPLEMNNASAGEVVAKVRQSAYRGLFDEVYGAQSLPVDDTTRTFDQIARAIAAYETSREVNAFSSKYDAFLAGRAKLTAPEARGLKLFAGKSNCTACHPHERGADGSPPLFTDFTYDNVGTPKNPANPFYRASTAVNPDGPRYRDMGIGLVVQAEAHRGKVKVPTLRNVAKKPQPQFVKSYLHNGAFKSLKQVVHFYNMRDKTPQEFGAPDVTENVNRDELGNLGLTEAEENDLVAFLETLSDGYIPLTPPDQFPKTPPVAGEDRFRGARSVLRVSRYRLDIQQAARDSEAIRR